jgi:hypothetical protein
MEDRPMSEKWKENKLKQITQKITGDPEISHYFLLTGEITNYAYRSDSEKIKILLKNGKVKEMGEASDIKLSAFTKTVRKYFACYPKELDIK